MATTGQAGLGVRDRGAADSASRAWHQAAGSSPVTRLEPLQEGVSTRVYRMQTTRGSVVAKSGLDGVRLESSIYEEILPSAGIQAAEYLGSSVDGRTGTAWLFMKEATGEPYDEASPAHRTAASLWLGRLHSATSALRVPPDLPRIDAATYKSELDEAAATIQGALPAAGDARNVLESLLVELRCVEGRWGAIAEAVERGPRCLVHRDFYAKNVFVQHDRNTVRLTVLDWDRARYGSPAQDLAALDFRTYARGAQSDQWLASVRPLFPLGDLLRTVSWVRQWVRGIIFPMSYETTAGLADCMERLKGSRRRAAW